MAPIASVWYRGNPAGVPRQADLAEIGALGFTGVTWPIAQTAGLADLKRMADVAGLAVITRADSKDLTPASAMQPVEFIDVRLAKMAPAETAPLVWRAIAHGARVISFDAGLPAGTGVSDRSGRSAAWVNPAQAIARQLRFNDQFFDALRRVEGPTLAIDPRAPAGLDLVFLQTPRSWVIFATNTAPSRVRAVVHLPAGIPYALWVNLLDNAPLAMLSQPAGPRWNLDLEAHAARVYFIDKAPHDLFANCFTDASTSSRRTSRSISARRLM